MMYRPNISTVGVFAGTAADIGKYASILGGLGAVISGNYDVLVVTTVTYGVFSFLGRASDQAHALHLEKAIPSELEKKLE